MYKYALTEALQTNFTLTEAAIDRLHRGILRELKTKCKQLVKEGLVTNEDISRKLEYQVIPILQEAKKANKKRKFSWNSERIKGLYNGFPSPVYDYEVVEGGNNDAVVREIRQWLCDFNNFCSSVGGCWETVGSNFDKVKEDLKVQKLLPGIFTSSKTSRSINDVNVNLASDIIIHPIEMKLFAHGPDVVEMVTEDLTLSSWTMKCSITKQGIRRSISNEGNIEFVFPCYSKVNVNSTVEADIEFKATKEYQVQTWAVVLSFGINTAFDTCKSKSFVHRMKLIIRTPDSSVTLRKPVTIEISKDQADKFMEHYNHFKDIISAMAGPQDNTAPSLLPGETFIAMCERFPCLLFVETLRRGGVDAAMEMVKKKPEVLRNLPGNENNVLGITFEELQIAKIMAEAIRKNVPIELIAGDGHGRFRYNGREMKTPEYADAVFRNTKTGEYFSVQFKYTDEAMNLIEMMEHWHTNWKGNADNSNYPEAMRLENVKLVGPKDVVNTIRKRSIDVGAEVRSNFEQSERIGFKYPIDETETMRTFLHDNETLLKDLVNSEEYGRYKSTKNDISQMKKELKSFGSKVDKVLEKLEHQVELRDIALQEGKTTKGLDKGITKINKNVADLRGKITNHEQTISNNEREIKSIEESWSAHFEENLTVTYRQKYTNRAMLKEAALNVAVMATVDGITTFVCTFGDEWKKYHDGKISIGELVKVVTKETVIATARGAGFGLALSGMNMVAQYATANGFAYAGTLTVASKVTCPIVMAGMLMKQSHDIIKHWNAGDITTAEMEKAFGRSITANGLSIGGMMLCGSAIGGPLGLVVGAGLAIAVGVGDYFLGDKVWSKIIKEDPKEALALMERKINDLCEDVLHAAYDLLDLTEYSTREEIKEKYRVAILKYHPDKGGSADIFHAVHAAYEFICNARHFDCVK